MRSDDRWAVWSFVMWAMTYAMWAVGLDEAIARWAAAWWARLRRR